MRQYHKIQTVYKRDPETKMKHLLEGQFSLPEFEYLQDNKWVGTEKIDGTNIRVMWDGERSTIGGKTDNAQIPMDLVNHLEGSALGDRLGKLFPPQEDEELFPEVCLYGEGYGRKIQKGGRDYIPDGVGFILFDVYVNGWWLKRSDVEDIASKLEIPIAPIIVISNLLDAVEFVKRGFSSEVAEGERLAEGLVLRPEVELKDRAGRRIITKIKYKDFPHA